MAQGHRTFEQRDGAARRAVAPLAAAAGFMLMLAAALPSHGAGAHVHGVAMLQVAVDGNRLTVEFTSPLENLVGFERAARTDKEKDAMRRLGERLQQAELDFVPSPEARCTPGAVKVDTAHPTGGHAEVSMNAVFRCERPQRLKGLEVKLFDAFPNLKRIDAQVAGPKKQASAKLAGGNRRLFW